MTPRLPNLCAWTVSFGRLDTSAQGGREDCFTFSAMRRPAWQPILSNLILTVVVSTWQPFAEAFLSPSPHTQGSPAGPTRDAALLWRGGQQPLRQLVGTTREAATVMQAIVGTGGSGRRGRGRGGGDDGRPVNMSDDKYYEEFFNNRMKKRMVNYEDKVEAAYYEGVDKNVRFADNPDAWDGSPDAFTSLSRDQALKLGLGAALGTVGFMAAQRWHLLRRYTSPTAFIHSYDSQTARRPFTLEQLRTAVRKASTSGYSGLPDAPTVPSSLPFLRGEREDLLASAAQGKAIVYCFWRASDANAAVVLRKLEGLMVSLGEDVDVVSIHCPKYDYEASTDAVEAAIRRVELSLGAPLRQKVVNDAGLSLWKGKGLDTWPTVAITPPKSNKVLFVGVGERVAASPFLESALSALLQVLRGRAETDELKDVDALSTLDYDESRDKELRAGLAMGPSPLAFPGDVAVDADNDRLYIADTGNHRILVTDLEGKYLRTIGAGTPGFKDGYKTEACFLSPCGLSLDRARGVLYVADSLNDAVRSISLDKNDLVTTLKPSNMAAARRKDRELGGVREDLLRVLADEGKDATVTSELGARRALRLPTQLALLDGNLYIAATGSNQLWRFDPYDFELRPIAGSGEAALKNRRDTKLSDLSAASALAQPTALAALPGKLLVGETESSTIRLVDFRQRETPLSTLFGSDKLFAQDLSAFGDKDGFARNVRLQFPAALCSLRGGGSALLSDSYNHKVKLIDDKTEVASCRTLAGTGKPGFKDGPGYAAEFNEPKGLGFDQNRNRAYICDSNNHAIRVIDVERATVTTLSLDCP